MERKQIQQFIEAMAASDLAEMEVNHEGWTLRLARSGRPALNPAARVSASPARADAFVPVDSRVGSDAQETPVADLLAPLYGTVHLQSSPGAPALVKVGDTVQPGQLLCIIEAMKVFHELHAERPGTVREILVETGSEVEAGQRLLHIQWQV